MKHLNLLWCVYLAGSLTAQSATAQGPLAQPVARPPFEIPTVFTKSAPGSVEELRDFEKHVEKILPVLRAATVNLRVGNAQGTGIIVNSEGLILTAAHVSGEPGGRVSILTEDSLNTPNPGNGPPGRRGRNRGGISGVTLGRDKTLDASMVRIESERKDWPWCPVAKVEAEAGDWCIVLGHPGGLDRDRGIVVRVGRVISRDRMTIQTDCELIGGDSGGPLFNMKGEVIGINSRIGEGLEINLHVPALAYTQSWDRMVNSEAFATHTGAYLGVKGIPNPNGKGLLVQQVFDDSAAKEADVRVGDILLSLDNKEVTSLEQLRELVGLNPPRMQIQLKLLRNSEELTVRAKPHYLR